MMMRRIRPSDWVEMAGGMSAIQRDALLATTADDSPVPTMVRLGASDPLGVAFERDGELVALAGAVIVHPGVASTFMYATDLSRVILALSTYFRDLLFPYLRHIGVHRVHSLGPAHDPGGIRWKEDILGAWPEAHLEKFGKNGEDYVLHTVML